MVLALRVPLVRWDKADGGETEVLGERDGVVPVLGEELEGEAWWR